jgi:hypothetical protein
MGTAPPSPTTPTPNDLGVLYGGRNRLLTVREVAEQLEVCAATVYRLCEERRAAVRWLRAVDPYSAGRPRGLPGGGRARAVDVRWLTTAGRRLPRADYFEKIALMPSRANLG